MKDTQETLAHKPIIHISDKCIHGGVVSCLGPEDGDTMFLRNFGISQQNHTAPKHKTTPSSHCRENLKSQTYTHSTYHQSANC
jgi:hypothetical protein